MAYTETSKRWAGIFGFKKRSQQRVDNNLGIIPYNKKNEKLYRDNNLHKLDKYYEGTIYDHLMSWDEAACAETYVPIRQRRPRLQFRFAKVICSRITSMLIGSRVFPTLNIVDDPDTQEFLKLVGEASKIKSRLLEPIRRMCASGSVFVRFYITGGALKIEHYLSKYCYPVFNEAGELDSIVIQYVYDDPEEKDQKGNYVKKWYKLELTTTSDILYDNPVYNETTEPVFQVVSEVEHDLGFVQGEWFRTCEERVSPDGYSLIQDVLDFITELDYSLSQSSQAVGYNQDPQVMLQNMDEDEMNTLIRSATKAWNMGREGDAKFLEAGMTGVEAAMNLRDKVRLHIQDIARVVLMDPEKVAGYAQSGKSLEILHLPMIELCEELRPVVGDSIINLHVKMALAMLMANRQGIQIPFAIPEGYMPKSLSAIASWPPIFQQTIEDLQKKIGAVSGATSASLISRETGTKYLAKDFGVEDVEAEIAKVAAQPVINPFGGF